MHDRITPRARRLARRLVAPVRRSPSAFPGDSAADAPSSPATMLADSRLLPPGPDRRVVLLCDEKVRAELMSYLQLFHGDRTLVLAETSPPDWQLGRWGARFVATPNPAVIQQAVTRFGPIDVVVDLRTGTDAEHLTWWNQLFLHVREGGAYAVERQRITERAAVDDGLFAQLAKLLPHVGSRRAEMAGLTNHEQELALSASQVLVTTELVVVGKRMAHLLKLRDSNATQILNQRETGLEVTPLATLKATKVRTAGKLHTYGGGEAPVVDLDIELSVPELHLRRYRGRLGVCPGAIVVHDHTVLPDSFKWARQERLRNPRLVDVDPKFARLPADRRPVEELEGSYYYLDHYNTGHFGHVMTELVAKLWGWDAAKAAVPDLKVLLRENERTADRPFPRMEERLLTAYGVDPDDIVWVDRAVWVDSLVAATPMWHNAEPHYAHPDITRVWRRLREGFSGEAATDNRRIFVSRPHGSSTNRHCHNAEEVEGFFEERGFSVVHPEKLDLADQVETFAQAEVVAGFGGSAMFNVLFAEHAHSMIVLSHEAYDSRNEHLYAAVLGLDAHFFSSAPDLPHPEDGWSRESFQSPWSFDFARNGDELGRVIAELP